jgi:FtsZ-binding cell division protein ZapB
VADINYKEGMKLTDEDMDILADKCPTLDLSCVDDYPQEFNEIIKAQLKKCLRVLSSMELPELQEQIAEYINRRGFHSGLNYEEEISRKTCNVTSVAILDIIQPIIAAQRVEIEELEEQNLGLKEQIETYGHLGITNATLKTDNERLKEQLRVGNHLYAELTDKFNDSEYNCHELNRQLSTARAEIAKEIFEGIAILPRKSHTFGHDRCISENDIVKFEAAYLTPDKEGGK